MKLLRFTLALCCLIITVSDAFSQLLSSSYPTPGYTAKYLRYPMTVNGYQNLAATGNNYTWDLNPYFSSFGNGAAMPDTLRYVNPAQTPYPTAFPTANIAIVGDTIGSWFYGPYSFFNKTNTYVEEVGIGEVANGAYPVALPFVHTLKWLVFPFSLGQGFRDTGIVMLTATGSLIGAPYDSLHYKRILYRTDTLDGFGTFKFNRRLYTNCYRNNVHDIYIDSIWAKNIGSNWTLIDHGSKDLRQLSWLTNGADFMVGEIEWQDDTARGILAFPPDPITTRLEIQNFPTTAYCNSVIGPVQVVAKYISTGQVNTNFNDSVTLTWAGNGPGGLPRTVAAHNGVAVFDTIHLTGTLSGIYGVVARNDTVLPDSASTSIALSLPAVATRFGPVRDSVAEYECLPTFHVNLVDMGGNIDAIMVDTVHIGKISGPGKVLGNTTQLASNGAALFDSISFNYPGTYQVIAYSDTLTIGDTVTVVVSDVPQVTWGFSRLDTMDEILNRAQQFVWSGNADGFLSGTSRTFWTEIGERFPLSNYGQLKEVDLYFSDKYVIGSADTLMLKVYNTGVQVKNDSFTAYALNIFSKDLPIQLLGSAPLSVDSIVVGDFFNRQPTRVMFDPPVNVSADFTIALETNSPAIDDTVILWGSTLGDGHGEHRNSRLLHNSGNPAITDWIPDYKYRPSYDIDFMMIPILQLDTVSIDTVFVIPTGIAKTTEAASVLMFPNPASLSFSMAFKNIEGKLSFELFSVDGRIIQIKELNVTGTESVYTNNVADLPGGIYVVKVAAGNWASTFKLVVKH